MSTPSTAVGDPFGYVLVHFVEDRHGHAEKIYLSLSDGDDPLTWTRLRGGEPVLEWTGGTTGVRDPHLVRGHDGFHVVATDLRVWGPDGAEPDWHQLSTHGSHDLVVWDSPDLVTWSEPRAVTVAPAGAGMAWAPETVWDPVGGQYLVHWSSRVDGGDSSIWVARSTDMRTFSAPERYLSLPGGVIDMTVAVVDGRVHRFAKHDDEAPGSMRVFHQVGSSFFADDFVTVATDLGPDGGAGCEGPLVFPAHDGRTWYLWVDCYGRTPQGYRALRSQDPASGRWELLEDSELHLPPATKHGAVLPLRRAEWEALAAALG